MKECKINEYLSVREEGNSWNLYITKILVKKDEYRLYNISPEEIFTSTDYSSAQEYYCKNRKSVLKKISFDQACTFLEEWYKYQYNTELLTPDGAFPLLRMLYIVGEPLAQKVFESELLKHFKKGQNDSINYLIDGDYENYLRPEEIEQLPKKMKKIIEKAYIIKRFIIRYKHAKSTVVEDFSYLDQVYDDFGKELDERFADLLTLPYPKEEQLSDYSYLTLNDKQAKKLETVTFKELTSILYEIIDSLKAGLKDKNRITKEVIINSDITLKLIDNKTIAYVIYDTVVQCKFYGDTEKLDSFPKPKRLEPETAFETHCSNIKRWVENGYDSKTLPKKIRFPLLKKLAILKDDKAQQRLKEEVIKQYMEEKFSEMEYRILEEYLPFLNEEDLDRVYRNTNNLEIKSGIAKHFAKTKNVLKALEIYYECKYTTNRESLKLFADVWFWMVSYYIKNKDYINAIRAQKQLLRLDPNNVRYWNNLGNLYFFKVKDYEKALNAYLKAWGLDPFNCSTAANLALTYSKLGNDSLGFYYINQTWRIAPDYRLLDTIEEIKYFL